nr:MAG TPA: protein of unknown function (DUF4269) [Bacteriophage sp.]
MKDFAAKWKYRLSQDSLTDYAHVVDEAMNSICSEVLGSRPTNETADIDFSSFTPQQELNPKIWPNGKINSRVRLRLMDIADDFFATLKIDWLKPLDILLTGSMANYNWSKYSDFDLHLLLDFSDVDENVDFVHEYFTAKKKLWNEEHENLMIYGFPVEVYVQDISEPLVSNGIYSLYKNKWVVEPSRDAIKSLGTEKETIKAKAIETMKKIDALYNATFDISYGYDGEKIIAQIKKLINIIKGIRKESLSNGGEMSAGNIFFKILRRTGYIEKLFTAKTLAYDRKESIY